MDTELPFSQASENNKLPILEVLKSHLDNTGSVLEIGGGTGQHAVFFANIFPKLVWHSSDLPANVDSLALRIERAALPNLPHPFPLDVNSRPWQSGSKILDIASTQRSKVLLQLLFRVCRAQALPSGSTSSAPT